MGTTDACRILRQTPRTTRHPPRRQHQRDGQRQQHEHECQVTGRVDEEQGEDNGAEEVGDGTRIGLSQSRGVEGGVRATLQSVARTPLLRQLYRSGNASFPSRLAGVRIPTAQNAGAVSSACTITRRSEPLDSSPSS